jgi:hypothetical protein
MAQVAAAVASSKLTGQRHHQLKFEQEHYGKPMPKSKTNIKTDSKTNSKTGIKGTSKGRSNDKFRAMPVLVADSGLDWTETSNPLKTTATAAADVNLDLLAPSRMFLEQTNDAMV